MKLLSHVVIAFTTMFSIGGVATLAEAPLVVDSPPTVIVAPSAIQRVWRDPEATAKPKALCPQWWDTAISAGWQIEQLPTLDYIMNRESRCLPKSHNTTLNADGSADLGLTQVNDRSWCMPTKWYPNGYLQTVGVLQYCKQLFNPYINLKAAKAIYDYAQETNNNGFGPWGR